MRFYVEVTETTGDTSESVWSLCKYGTAGEVQIFDSIPEAESAFEAWEYTADNESMGGHPISYTYEVREFL